MISRRAMLLGVATSVVARSPANPVPSPHTPVQPVFDEGPSRFVVEGSHNGLDWHLIAEVHNGYGMCDDRKVRRFFMVRATAVDKPVYGVGTCEAVPPLEDEDGDDEGAG